MLNPRPKSSGVRSGMLRRPTRKPVNEWSYADILGYIERNGQSDGTGGYRVPDDITLFQVFGLLLPLSESPSERYPGATVCVEFSPHVGTPEYHAAVCARRSKRIPVLGTTRYERLFDAEGLRHLRYAVGGYKRAASKRRKRPRRTKSKLLTKQQDAVVEAIEKFGMSIPQIAKAQTCSPQAVYQLYQRAHRNPCYKQRSIDLEKAKKLHPNIRNKADPPRDE